MNLDELSDILNRLETLRSERDDFALEAARKMATTGVITESAAAETVELLVRLGERAAEEALLSELSSEDLRIYAIKAARMAEEIGRVVFGNRLARVR